MGGLEKTEAVNVGARETITSGPVAVKRGVL
jgi:hypothetical protein